ncbi:hypothetical protein [Helicobacter pylori]|uniref:hypothetical protein n=1 Tax=Helicobacter pylori TaxID=210 RepID=UPI00165C15A7|nr:hypothetical protein [Helicobacter pylori]
MDLKNKSFRSHTAYTSALKNDLLLNPNLVEAERKFLQAFGMAQWLYLKMNADNQVGNQKA